MVDKYDVLKLENQVCFPLYACSKEIIRKYKTFLDEIDLTYTQYITMLVMWEEKEIGVKNLGEKLYLDSGTLTPVLKRLEQKGYINRKRSLTDERILIVTLTKTGDKLKDKALDIPFKIANCLGIELNEAKTLYSILYKILASNEK